VLHAHNAGLPAADAAIALGYDVAQIERAYTEIEQKRATTQYLHAKPMLVEPVAEITDVEFNSELAH